MQEKKCNLKARLNKPRKNWIKAIVWCVLYFIFLIWLNNYKWILIMPFIFDLYITQYIKWDWWKSSKNVVVRTVMGWIDAIVFALIAVYLINNFFFQNYQIPTSSLEKTLLVGDFLAVSKVNYGPRVPITPLSLPLVQNTLPILQTKSYLEHPKWKYRRLPGLDSVKRNDIVVFNFPAGDTIAVKAQNPDYYINCYQAGYNYITNNLNQEPNTELCYKYGRELIAQHPEYYGEVMYRPVDRRENYVKRCVAVAGDWLEIKENQIFINGKAQEKFPGVQYNYLVQTDGMRIGSALREKLHISNEDFVSIDNIYYNGILSKLGFSAKYPVYHFPLTAESYNILANTTGITKMVVEPYWLFSSSEADRQVYPTGWKPNWNRDNYGPIYIPRKGATITLTEDNIRVYERVIRNYEGNTLTIANGEYTINGKVTNSYTFKMNYYWMMGDNRHKSADSRYWGFVPEDHIVGQPMFVWLSLDKDKSLFDGKIRFNRFFKSGGK